MSDRTQIIEDYKKLSGKLNRVPSVSDIKKAYKEGEISSLKNIYKEFDSINTLRKECGLISSSKYRARIYENTYNMIGSKTVLKLTNVKTKKEYNALIDTLNLKKVQRFYWIVWKHKSTNNLYIRTVENGEFIDLNHYLFGDNLTQDSKLSYKDGNKFNITIENVAIVPKNMKKFKSEEYKKKVKGVRCVEGRYEARIGVNGQHVYLGRYDTYDEALKARKYAEEQYKNSESLVIDRKGEDKKLIDITKLKDIEIIDNPIELYEIMLNQEFAKYPKGYWSTNNKDAYENAKEVTKYLIEKVLNFTDEDIKNKLSVKIIKQYKLQEMLNKLFLNDLYSLIDNVYPSKYKRWELQHYSPTKTKWTKEEAIEAFKYMAEEKLKMTYFTLVRQYDMQFLINTGLVKFLSLFKNEEDYIDHVYPSK